MAKAEDNSSEKYKVQLIAEPARVVSDGKQEVSLRCVFTPAGGARKQKPSKEDIPVEFKCKKLKLDEKKISSKGAAALKIKPARPVGKTRITVTTPYGDAHATITVNPTPQQWVKDMLQSLAIAFVVAMLIVRPFLLQTFFIPSGSMENTFFAGDRLLATMFNYRFSEPQRGDVVIFKSKLARDCRTYNLVVYKYKNCENYIKRLIGLPGDTVEVRDGVTLVNGKALKEPYLKELQLRDFERTRVPPGQLFFMGDNRNNSNDSRFWGFLPRERVAAKAWVHFWPPGRMKVVRHTRYN